MNKSENVKDFVERVDDSKKLNPKDLSSDQDMTIALMNLISIEEHLIFSGAKTGNTNFYDLIEEIREVRKNLMLKLIPAYEGEVWCISKHLLAASMRLLEVGTKQQSLGNKEEAYKMFNQSYDLYCLFWGLNMNMLDAKDLKWIEPDIEKVKALSAKVAEATPSLKPKETDAKPAPSASGSSVPESGGGAFLSKMKGFVKKAVDCCIE